jgi:hypothetical protein
VGLGEQLHPGGPLLRLPEGARDDAVFRARSGRDLLGAVLKTVELFPGQLLKATNPLPENPPNLIFLFAAGHRESVER